MLLLRAASEQHDLGHTTHGLEGSGQCRHWAPAAPPPHGVYVEVVVGRGGAIKAE